MGKTTIRVDTIQSLLYQLGLTHVIAGDGVVVVKVEEGQSGENCAGRPEAAGTGRFHGTEAKPPMKRHNEAAAWPAGRRSTTTSSSTRRPTAARRRACGDMMTETVLRLSVGGALPPAADGDEGLIRLVNDGGKMRHIAIPGECWRPRATERGLMRNLDEELICCGMTLGRNKHRKTRRCST